MANHCHLGLCQAAPPSEQNRCLLVEHNLLAAHHGLQVCEVWIPTALAVHVWGPRRRRPRRCPPKPRSTLQGKRGPPPAPPPRLLAWGTRRRAWRGPPATGAVTLAGGRALQAAPALRRRFRAAGPPRPRRAWRRPTARHAGGGAQPRPSVFTSSASSHVSTPGLSGSWYMPSFCTELNGGVPTVTPNARVRSGTKSPAVYTCRPPERTSRSAAT
jgi:hypothetical protein